MVNRVTRRASGARSGPPRQRRGLVGETPIAHQFFAGHYAEIARTVFDAPGAVLEAADVAFAVGALTFLGRLDDARTCFEAARLRGAQLDERTLAASRFFFGLAQARAGNFERAKEFLVARVRAQLRTRDAWAVAFVHQGLACQRYFTGRYKAAARHALRALRAAHAAAFPYAQLLATDLRGHALVQIGQARAGLELLERAKGHATALGLSRNVFAIECSIATYSLKFEAGERHVRELEGLLARQAHDSYSRHALLTEYAAALALRGRGTAARAALAEADEVALRGDARRGRVSSLLARLAVARFGEGAAGCARTLAEAAPLVDDSDVTFRAELLGFEAFVARAERDAPRLARAVDGLRSLAKSHDLHWAKAALEQFSDDTYRVRAFAEDQLTPLMRSVVHREEAALPRLLAAGLLGAVPELLGLTPGRRIVVLLRESALLLEDHGDVVVRFNPPRWCPVFLRLLGSGDVAKEVLVHRMWGLRSYRPERHDPLLRTAIHRLRAFLEPYGSWVRVTSRGYGSSVPVVFVGEEEGEVTEFELSGPEEELALSDAPGRLPSSPRSSPPSRTDRLCALLASEPGVSLDGLSRKLALSRSTVLRLLRPLLLEKRVVKRGFARATRYQLAE